jgi:hypothetical protein
LKSGRVKGRPKRPDESIQDERVVKALKMISEGSWTIRRAAMFAGLTYYEILDKMAEKGISSDPDLKDIGNAVPSRQVKDSLTVLIGKKPRFRHPIVVEKLEEQSENR